MSYCSPTKIKFVSAFIHRILRRRSWLFNLHGSIKVGYKSEFCQKSVGCQTLINSCKGSIFRRNQLLVLALQDLEIHWGTTLTAKQYRYAHVFCSLRKILFQDYCIAVSKRVLTRMCLYWLPRYLLHLRMKDLSKDSDFADKKFHTEMKKIRLEFQIDAGILNGLVRFLETLLYLWNHFDQSSCYFPDATRIKSTFQISRGPRIVGVCVGETFWNSHKAITFFINKSLKPLPLMPFQLLAYLIWTSQKCYH